MSKASPLRLTPYLSVFPRRDVAGQFAERAGGRAERGEAHDRAGHAVVRKLSGSLGSVERRIGFLSSLRVSIGIFAQFLARPCHVRSEERRVGKGCRLVW